MELIKPYRQFTIATAQTLVIHCYSFNSPFVAFIGFINSRLLTILSASSQTNNSSLLSLVDRCLLYSMQMWGSNIESLLIASGTIYNQVIHFSLFSLLLQITYSFQSNMPMHFAFTCLCCCFHVCFV